MIPLKACENCEHSCSADKTKLDFHLCVLAFFHGETHPSWFTRPINLIQDKTNSSHEGSFLSCTKQENGLWVEAFVCKMLVHSIICIPYSFYVGLWLFSVEIWVFSHWICSCNAQMSALQFQLLFRAEFKPRGYIFGRLTWVTLGRL